MAEPPVEQKLWRRRENASLTRIRGAWIAKLPDNGMAQCNLCTDFSISSGGRTEFLSGLTYMYGISSVHRLQLRSDGWRVIPCQLNQWLPGDRPQYCPKNS